MSQHSLVCIVTRLKMTQERMEHKELVERRLREVLVEKEIMMWRKIIMVGQIRGWKEMKDSCGQVVDTCIHPCLHRQHQHGSNSIWNFSTN